MRRITQTETLEKSILNSLKNRLILVYLESCLAGLEKPHAISVKLTVLTLIKEINIVAKHSIRDLFHEK